MGNKFKTKKAKTISTLIYSMDDGIRHFLRQRNKKNCEAISAAIKCFTISMIRCGEQEFFMGKKTDGFIEMMKMFVQSSGDWRSFDLNEDSPSEQKLILISLEGERRNRNFTAI